MYSSSLGQKKHVVYKGVEHDGLKHIIRHKDGSRSLVNQTYLLLIDQIGFDNLPSTPLKYCNEVGKGITQEQAQRLAYLRSLTPEQQELMSWHHCLYHLPFHKMLTLAKFGMLPKRFIKL